MVKVDPKEMQRFKKDLWKVFNKHGMFISCDIDSRGIWLRDGETGMAICEVINDCEFNIKEI